MDEFSVHFSSMVTILIIDIKQLPAYSIIYYGLTYYANDSLLFSQMQTISRASCQMLNQVSFYKEDSSTRLIFKFVSCRSQHFNLPMLLFILLLQKTTVVQNISNKSSPQVSCIFKRDGRRSRISNIIDTKKTCAFLGLKTKI